MILCQARLKAKRLASRTPCAVAASLALLMLSPNAKAFCFDEAQALYGVEASILRGVSRVESSNNPLAINSSHKARTGSVDIGMMQINSRHLPALAKFGITYEHLLDACTNIKVGAWLLADLFRSKGDSWDAVGANNAACTQLKGAACQQARSTYAWKVYRAMNIAGLRAAVATTQPVASVPRLQRISEALKTVVSVQEINAEADDE